LTHSKKETEGKEKRLRILTHRGNRELVGHSDGGQVLCRLCFVGYMANGEEEEALENKEKEFNRAGGVGRGDRTLGWGTSGKGTTFDPSGRQKNIGLKKTKHGWYLSNPGGSEKKRSQEVGPMGQSV